MASSDPSAGHVASHGDAADYIAWLRREPLFRSRVRDIGEALRSEHRDDSRAELLDAVQRISSVLPPSARGLWLLLLDEGMDLVVGRGGSLEDAEWERLTATARARLLDDRPPLPSDDADLERALLKIDPAAPVLLPSAWIASPTSRQHDVAA